MLQLYILSDNVRVFVLYLFLFAGRHQFRVKKLSVFISINVSDILIDGFYLRETHFIASSALNEILFADQLLFQIVNIIL
jgi:hypothetical protein